MALTVQLTLDAADPGDGPGECFEPAPRSSLGFIVMQDPEGNEFCLD